MYPKFVQPSTENWSILHPDKSEVNDPKHPNGPAIVREIMEAFLPEKADKVL